MTASIFHRVSLRECSFLLAALALSINTTSRSIAEEPIPIRNLLDLSGLAWVGGDKFLGVHDAKDTSTR